MPFSLTRKIQAHDSNLWHRASQKIPVRRVCLITGESACLSTTTTLTSGEIQIDNGIFRVTKWVIEPGGEIPMHVHKYDYVVVPLVDDTMFVTKADGSKLRAELRIGQSYTRPVGIEHSVLNRGTAPIAFIEIEKLS